MRRSMMLALGFMILLTVIVVWETAYQDGISEGRLLEKEVAQIKHPYQYVPRFFYTKELENETEPVTWYTPEQLGIVLIRNEVLNRYDVYIISGQEDKALAWMNQTDHGGPRRPEIKYDDQYYEIIWNNICLGELGKPFHERFGMLILLALGWGIFVPFAYALSVPQPPRNQARVIPNNLR